MIREFVCFLSDFGPGMRRPLATCTAPKHGLLQLPAATAAPRPGAGPRGCCSLPMASAAPGADHEGLAPAPLGPAAPGAAQPEAPSTPGDGLCPGQRQWARLSAEGDCAGALGRLLGLRRNTLLLMPRQARGAEGSDNQDEGSPTTGGTRALGRGDPRRRHLHRGLRARFAGRGRCAAVLSWALGWRFFQRCTAWRHVDKDRAGHFEHAMQSQSEWNSLSSLESQS